ncbi:MAG: hypothetical protein AAGF93_06380 [Cyanobacteria bacterium P01_H01_bin.105]
MFLENTEGTTTVVPKTGVLPDYQHEVVRHMVFGSLTAVRLTIQDLHQRRYAEPNDWSKPISTGRPNEVMAILTKRVVISP